ncbi:hypothetical protein AAFN88_07410 [Pelagibius sp. CAU 1746]|uniref:hypothetical protein n=1 Tax=Pelagibius sp. CAU 1746 TaxID=3140370 RepID=UPI00325A5A09
MPTWLVFLVLEALGLFLLWNGARGDELLFALGLVLVFSVTALALFRLLVKFLERRSSGKPRPPAATIPLFVRPIHLALLDGFLGSRAAGRGRAGEEAAGPGGVDLDAGGGG